MGPTTLSPGRSIDLLDEVVGGGLGREIHRRLQRRFPRVSRDDIDDAYQAAYLATRNSASLRGTTTAEVARYLTVAAERRLLIAARRSRHEIPDGDEALATAIGEDDTVAKVVDDLDAEIDLGPVVHEIAAKLNERQRDVLALYCSDARRKDIAKELRISEKAAKKDLEAILAKGRNLLVGKAGGGCPDGSEMVTALAFGLLRNPRELAGAQNHLAGCDACTGLYERLEMFRDAAAAILPLPTGDAATNAGVIERTTQKLADAAAAAKQQLADATSNTKMHATNVYTRAADPTPLAGARPGTVGAVIASCVAVGSGATYCAQQSFDPIRALAGSQAEEKAEQKPGKPKAAQADSSPPPPVIPTPPATTTPDPAPQPTPPAQAAPTPAPTPEVDPAQQGGSTRQFDPGAAASPAAAAPAPQPSQPTAPAPASGGEFSGP